ncbi:OLC1v1031807C1 [Oldenlandia corymbosa var. corymbosa]|uniref:OLC1v1031807C1 n=1 Tax=Oldenlandia corymbosa var. corymbosa TaxID=529605 RepID=A0AAV1CML2_OLDCO|nr:OLC1v1031807C1 [Oldenlandia corymbosa var. corymbosa]
MMTGSSRREHIEEVVTIGGLVGLQFIYAGNSVLLGYLMMLGFTTESLVILNSFATFLILLPFTIIFERNLWPRKFTLKLWIKLILASFGGVTLCQPLLLKGINLTSPAMGTAMPNLAPGFIFFIAWLFRLEKVELGCKYSRAKIAGTMLCVIGAVIMSLLQSTMDGKTARQSHSLSSHTLFDAQKILGCMYLMVAVLLLSSTIVLQATILGDLPAPMSITAITSLFGVILTGLVQWIQHGRIETGWPLLSFKTLICYSAVAGCISGVCISFNTWAMKKRGPVLVSIFNPIGTVIALILSVITLEKSFTIGSLAGMSIMFAGLYTVLWAKEKEKIMTSNEVPKESDEQQQQQQEQQKGHQEPIFKHYCKVCKRGFGCAGALGGHMRSHAVGDARWSTNNNNNQSSSSSLNDDHNKEFGIPNNLRSKVHPDHHHHQQGENAKHSYFLRTNTNRFMSNYRSSFSDDHHVRGENNINQRRSLIPRHGIVDNDRAAGKYLLSPMSSSESEVEEANHMIIKSTRVKSDTNYQDHDRHCSASSEEEDLANCLVMLSNRSFVLSEDHTNKVQGTNKISSSTNNYHHAENNNNNKGLFQCKACKKVFNSHQALGGHRASHKKVKGCYASKFNENDDQSSINEEDLIINQQAEELHFNQSENPSEQPAAEGVIDLDYSPNHNHDQLPNSTNPNHHSSTLSNKKSKSHQCSICQRVFSSGQALGGHKRCHWLTSNLPDSSIIQNLQDFNFGNTQQLFKKPHNMLPLATASSSEAAQLDLNFPPMLNNAADNLNMGSYYEAPARTFLQLWKNEDQQQVDKERDHHQQQQKCTKIAANKSKNDEEDVEEEDCRMKKIAKLSDLKDSDWLQVGIASTTHI